MRPNFSIAGLVHLALYSFVLGAPPRTYNKQILSLGPTCNTPSNRVCWAPGFDINTDWESKTPITGVDRNYTFALTEVDNYVGPDGQVKEKAMLINNQFPGPVITADWGDRVFITVINNLKANGTSFHWHGIRQLNNNINDGVNGVTECPIPPNGGIKVYWFLATQYGTSWYHSHYSSQYANGVTGSILINGPASLPYDIDLGVFPISDWYYTAADNLYARVNSPTNPIIPKQPGSPPPSNNILFNGTNVNPNGSGGSYSRVVLSPGKRHRLRLINPSVDNTFTVSIVGHRMTVIANDFVPVKPYTTQSLYMSVGQRYDVTIDADQKIGNYWINATFSNTFVCGSSSNSHPAAILTYTGAKGEIPTDSGTPPPESLCADLVDLEPVVTRTVPKGMFKGAPSQSLAVTVKPDETSNSVFWTVNGSAMNVVWENPTLQLISQGYEYQEGTSENIITIPENSEWSFWLIQNMAPIPHPMHLHGHDFVILGRSEAPVQPLSQSAKPILFDMATDGASLRYDNPPRRDATVLPSFGWLVVAFRNDNPGAWLFHCHIAWHASQGLSVQFLEKADRISKVMELAALEPNCQAWRKYSPTNPYPKIVGDSGL
ncbi:L559a mutant of Melanocarpus Albomyces laccase [Bombardia bombarda]|uniref:laccase n=1 Tax=Bombardia bombarda TaxID=252184 RepID=A0AA39WHX6_9PEZI|nr:L559a mutant of Melanocarpus Albomyces laccase [Bombardia bombarda]